MTMSAGSFMKSNLPGSCYQWPWKKWTLEGVETNWILIIISKYHFTTQELRNAWGNSTTGKGKGCLKWLVPESKQAGGAARAGAEARSCVEGSPLGPVWGICSITRMPAAVSGATLVLRSPCALGDVRPDGSRESILPGDDWMFFLLFKEESP